MHFNSTINSLFIKEFEKLIEEFDDILSILRDRFSSNSGNKLWDYPPILFKVNT